MEGRTFFSAMATSLTGHRRNGSKRPRNRDANGTMTTSRTVKPGERFYATFLVIVLLQTWSFLRVSSFVICDLKSPTHPYGGGTILSLPSISFSFTRAWFTM